MLSEWTEQVGKGWHNKGALWLVLQFKKERRRRTYYSSGIIIIIKELRTIKERNWIRVMARLLSALLGFASTKTTLKHVFFQRCVSYIPSTKLPTELHPIQFQTFGRFPREGGGCTLLVMSLYSMFGLVPQRTNNVKAHKKRQGWMKSWHLHFQLLTQIVGPTQGGTGCI